MLNHIALMGRLVREPEIRTTQAGASVVSFTLAVDRDYDREKTDFINCTAWRQTAEFIGKHFRKGQMMVAEGSLQSRDYTDKNDNKRTAWEVQVSGVHFAGDKKVAEPVKFTEVEDDGQLPF